jgi:hypothetical protein
MPSITDPAICALCGVGILDAKKIQNAVKTLDKEIADANGGELPIRTTTIYAGMGHVSLRVITNNPSLIIPELIKKRFYNATLFNEMGDCIGGMENRMVLS